MGCLIPTWCETVGDALENGVSVTTYCEVCQHRSPPSLLDLARDYGVDYWLWDRRFPCDRCGRELILLFTRRPSTPKRPMISTNRHDVARSERMRS
jgi:hypothetical protein